MWENKDKWITPHDLKVVGFLLVSFWVFAFLIDFFYYHQLLLGAVDHAEKFDEDEKSKALGLFGLTSSIKKRVSITTSRWMIAFFYLAPIIVGAFFYFFVP
jgi:hypothetical protein